MLNNTLQTLKERLLEPLPGIVAYKNMIPLGRGSYQTYNEQSVVKAAVLLCLYYRGDSLSLILIKRKANEKYDKHSGQISLPGGRYEDGDRQLYNTALRETYEEVGIHPSKIQYLGQLSDLYISASNHLVNVYVGFLEDKPTFELDPEEVDYIIEEDVDEFLKEEKIKLKNLKIRSMILRDIPYYDIQGETVWGATAMMISEFVYIYSQIKN